MQARITNARALGAGEYDFTGNAGERYRYLDLYDREAGKVVRISVAKDCICPAIPDEGATVDLWVELNANEKIVRGEDRDRSIGTLKLRAVDVQLSAKAKPLAQAA